MSAIYIYYIILSYNGHAPPNSGFAGAILLVCIVMRKEPYVPTAAEGLTPPGTAAIKFSPPAARIEFSPPAAPADGKNPHGRAAHAVLPVGPQEAPVGRSRQVAKRSTS